MPVLCFVLFNLGDYLGKHLAVWAGWPGPSKAGQWILLAMSLARVAFIPLLMFCNVAPDDRNTKVVFESEFYYAAFITMLAVSNGYVGNLALMDGTKVAAEDEANEENQEVAASVLVACLVVGCGLGSVVSNPIVRAL